MEKHFLVEFDFFDPQIEDIIVFEDRQQKIINEFKKTDRVVSLSVSDNEAVMWVVLKAESESELVFTMDSLVFPENVDYEYFELNLHISINTFESYSLN